MCEKETAIQKQHKGKEIGPIGRNLRYWMDVRGLKEEALCTLSGVSRSSIDRCRNGRDSSLKPETLEQLAKALSIDVDYLLDEEKTEEHRKNAERLREIISRLPDYYVELLGKWYKAANAAKSPKAPDPASPVKSGNARDSVNSANSGNAPMGTSTENVSRYVRMLRNLSLVLSTDSSLVLCVAENLLGCMGRYEYLYEISDAKRALGCLEYVHANRHDRDFTICRLYTDESIGEAFGFEPEYAFLIEGKLTGKALMDRMRENVIEMIKDMHIPYGVREFAEQYVKDSTWRRCTVCKDDEFYLEMVEILDGRMEIAATEYVESHLTTTGDDEDFHAFLSLPEVREVLLEQARKRVRMQFGVICPNNIDKS